MNRLKILRKEKGETQDQVAEVAGVSKRSYIYWENGERQIKPDKAQALADHFGVSVGYLLGYTDIAKQYDDEIFVDEYPSGPWFYSKKRHEAETQQIIRHYLIKLARESLIILSDKDIDLIINLINSLRADNPDTLTGQAFMEKYFNGTGKADEIAEKGFSIISSLDDPSPL
ncbi:TPA: helix-turn-helix domain-containing protein [Streptococcus suis]